MTEKVVRTPADVAEIEKTPIEARTDIFNTYELIKKGAAIDPESPALSFIPSGEAYDAPTVFSHVDYLAQLHRTANLFHDLGVTSNDVISLLLPNLPQTLFCYFGGEAVGIVNPINPFLEPAVIRDICLAANTRILVCLGDHPGIDIWEKVRAIRGDLPNLKAIVRIMGPGGEKEGIYGFDELISRYPGDRLDTGRRISPEDTASILHTGGTTGTPKLAPRSHWNEVSMALMIQLLRPFATGEAVLGGLPLFHNYAIMANGLLPLSIGAHTVLLTPAGYRDPSVVTNLWKIVDRYKPVCVPLVPTLLSTLLDIPLGGADISSIRFILSGAAPLSAELFQRFESRFQVKIREGYGLTEGTTGSSINPPAGEPKVGSVGIRMPYQEMKVFVLDTQGLFVRETETDEIGAICVKGPNIFRGYLDDRHNQGVWPKAGWLNTGDLGRVDADGYFWLTGRSKDLIIRGGHNIDPSIIEESLYILPGVHMAAAVGRPDAYAGEVPVAYVQLQAGADLTTEKIIAHLQKTIGERAAVPKEVTILDEIPLTAVGKIFKPALRWDAIRRIYRSELEGLGDLAASVEVRVGEDQVHGTSADVTVQLSPGVGESMVRQKVANILGRYTIRYRLEII